MAGDIDWIKEELEKIQSLPTLPVIASRLLNMLDSKTVSMADISKIIVVDPALTSRILKIANSPYYGMRNRIDTIKLALVILGINEIKNVLLSISLFRTFSMDDEEFQFDSKTFWIHSMATAHFAKKLAKDFRLKSHGEDFTAGLIHDIGKLIIAQYFTEFIPDIRKTMQKESIPNYEAEEKILGLSHMDIGAWLAEKWKLPAHLIQTIRFHHYAHLSEEHTLLCTIVALANLIANFHQFGNDTHADLDSILNFKGWEMIETSITQEEFNRQEYIMSLSEESEAIEAYVQALL